MVNIGKYDESYLLERAEEIVIAKTTGSNVMDPEAEEAIPRFHPQGEFPLFVVVVRPSRHTVQYFPSQLLTYHWTFFFSWKELEIGAILGKGGFCTVSEVSRISLASEAVPTTTDNFTANILQDRHYMAQNYMRNGTDSRYAIKTLSDSLMKDPERFVAGVIDLVIETKFLSIIRHPVSISWHMKSNLMKYLWILFAHILCSEYY
jgi:hypothetical protein